MKKIFQSLGFSIIFFLILLILMPYKILAATPSYQSLWDEESNAYLISTSLCYKKMRIRNLLNLDRTIKETSWNI